MALIARDLMVGNPKLGEMGLGEQAQGHQAIAAGFQGQRQWTDHFPNGDFLEAILNTSFDWNGKRAPYIVATENDALNGATMLFGHLLTNTAQIFADLRTYWSPDAVAEACDGYQLEGAAADGLLHLINSGPAALDGTGQQEADGKPTMKPFWEITRRGGGGVPAGDHLASVHHRVFPRRRHEHALPHPWRHAGDDDSHQSGRRAWARPCRSRKATRSSCPNKVHDVLDQRTNPTWPTTWFAPLLTGRVRSPRRTK